MLLERVNQWRFIDESGQRLENINRTHLVLASGKQVLQKKFKDLNQINVFQIRRRAPTILG